jgi:hypothetical protein
MKKMVYVLSKSGKPLMPTERHGWVRRCMWDGKVKVVKRFPFTIQLTYESDDAVQPVISETKEVFAAEYKIRTDVSDKVTEKRSYRSWRITVWLVKRRQHA